MINRRDVLLRAVLPSALQIEVHIPLRMMRSRRQPTAGKSFMVACIAEADRWSRWCVYVRNESALYMAMFYRSSNMAPACTRSRYERNCRQGLFCHSHRTCMTTQRLAWTDTTENLEPCLILFRFQLQRLYVRSLSSGSNSPSACMQAWILTLPN